MYIIQTIILISTSISIFYGMSVFYKNLSCRDRALYKVTHLSFYETLERKANIQNILIKTDFSCQLYITSNKDYKFTNSPLTKKTKVKLNFKGKTSNEN